MRKRRKNSNMPLICAICQEEIKKKEFYYRGEGRYSYNKRPNMYCQNCHDKKGFKKIMEEKEKIKKTKFS